jgi:hypothetical protein
MPGLLRAISLRYRYYSGATFTVAVAPLLLVGKNGDGSAATLSPAVWRYRATRYRYFLAQTIYILGVNN